MPTVSEIISLVFDLGQQQSGIDETHRDFTDDDVRAELAGWRNGAAQAGDTDTVDAVNRYRLLCDQTRRKVRRAYVRGYNAKINVVLRIVD